MPPLNQPNDVPASILMGPEPSSPSLTHTLELPHSYRFLDLREIIDVRAGKLNFNHEKFSFWIRAFRQGLSTPQSRGKPGRPDYDDEILQIYQHRRERKILVKSKRAEATAIRAEWQSHFPDREPPAVDTIRRQILNRSGFSGGLNS